jgi:hypothetical protein
MTGKSILLAVVAALPETVRSAVRTVSKSVSSVLTVVRTTAFWAAVVVPLAYPLLLFGRATDYGLLFSVLALHALALVVGHFHDGRRPGAGGTG